MTLAAVFAQKPEIFARPALEFQELSLKLAPASHGSGTS